MMRVNCERKLAPTLLIVVCGWTETAQLVRCSSGAIFVCLSSFHFCGSLRMSSTSPQLYGFPASTCTQRVLIAQHELGINLDFHSINLLTSEQKSEAHLARQPFGKVPALIDGAFTVYESRAIINYLVRKYGNGSSLLPSDAEKLARVEQFSSVESTALTPELTTISQHRVFAKFRPGFVVSDKAVEEAVEKLKVALTVVNTWLGQHAFLAGDDFTVVDIAFYPVAYIVFEQTEEGKQLLAAQPNVAAYWKRVVERPAIQKVAGIRDDFFKKLMAERAAAAAQK